MLEQPGHAILKIRLPAAQAPAWVLAESVAAAAFSLVSMLVIGRVIGPDATGVGTVAIAAFLIVDVVVAAMWPDALVQLPKLARRHADSALTAAILIGLAAGFGLVAIGLFLASCTGLPEVAWLVLALAPLLPMSAFSGTASGLYLREQRFRLLAMRLFIGQPVAVAIGLELAFSGHGPWAMVASQVAATLIAFMVMLRGGVAFRPRLDWVALRELWPIAGPQVAGVAVMVGKYRFFLLALGLMVTPNVLAVSHFGFRMLDAALGIVWQTVSRISMPRLCALQHDRPALAEAYGDLAQLQSLLGLPLCVGIALVAPDLVQVVLGLAWTGTAEATRVVAWAAVLGFLQGDYLALFVAIGKARRNLYIALVALALPMAALLVFQPRTPGGVAITWAMQSLIMPPVLTWIVLHELKRSPMWLFRRIAPGAIASAAMAVVVLAVQNAFVLPPLPRLLVSALSGSVVFVGVAWLVLRGRLPSALTATSSALVDGAPHSLA